MVWLTLLLLPLSWWFLNRMYGFIYGAKLKTRYAWASQGALLLGFRLKDWEVRNVC